MKTKFKIMGQLFKSGNNIFKSGNTIFRSQNMVKSTAPNIIATSAFGSGRGLCIDIVARRGYVSNQSGSVTIFNLDSFTNIATIPSSVGQFNTCIECDIDIAGQRLFVVNYGTGSVSVINLTNNTLITRFATGTNEGVVYDKVYNRVLAYSGTTLKVFSGSDYALLQTITTSVAINNQACIFYEGDKLFICSGSTQVSCFTLSDLSLPAIIIGQTQGGFSACKGIAASGRTGKLLVANQGTAPMSVLSLYNFNAGYTTIPVTSTVSSTPIALDNLNGTLYVSSGYVNKYYPIYN
jgi:DNA-binding beta-propeller fold protein YncE